MGIAVVPLPQGPIARRVLALTREIRSFRADIVHSWTVHDNAYAAVCGRLAGVQRRLGSLRGTMHSEGLRALPGLYTHLCFRAVDGLVVNSEALARELLEDGIGDERIHIVPNVVEPVRTPVIPADLSAFGCGPEHFVVGMVANLREVKNHELFLRAIAIAQRERPELRAVLVGQPVAREPEYEAGLRRRAGELGITDVVSFAGFRSDIPELLAAFQAVALSSHSEGMPNSLLEAMAAGLPVVATAVGGVADLVRDGENGFLSAPGDAEEMATSLVRLAADRNLARRLGEGGRHHVTSEHDGKMVAARLRGIYGFNEMNKRVAA